MDNIELTIGSIALSTLALFYLAVAVYCFFGLTALGIVSAALSAVYFAVRFYIEKYES
jgi:hypothetical protein